LVRAVTTFAIVSLGLASAAAQTETVLHTFTGGSDGETPFSGVTFDSAGNMFGTTLDGGSAGCGGYGCGTVFELSPTASGDWQESILFRFTGSKTGGASTGTLVLDNDGNIFGADLLGGSDGECSSGSNGLTGCGLIFKLSPSSGGWEESVLAVFDSSRAGELPYSGVVADSAGNLYGTTELGGITGCLSGCGTVFRLSPTLAGAWEETILHTFTGGADGGGSESPLIFDAAGNLYGTAGVVFELSPTANGGWKETVLYTFSAGADGDGSFTGLTFDAAGNLYGTTPGGGDLSGCDGYGCGVVFKLSPRPTGGWKETVLYQFSGKGDGSLPDSAVAIDAAGNLYGTTYEGGLEGQFSCYNHGCGVVYKLSPRPGGWKETLLHQFTGGADGAIPAGPVTLDAFGNLYGETENGGDLSQCSGFGCGVVFEIIP
jgi:uncharacterized repeat protein (TIGR03803 family)